MSIDFADYTTLNTYVLLAANTIFLTNVSTITTNTFPANYAAGQGFTGSGSITGGILDDANKTTGLSELSTLCDNLATVIAAGPTTSLPTIPVGGSITVTPGIYTINNNPLPFSISSSQTMVCEGPGTYIFTSTGAGSIQFSGTISLINGAEVTDIYWYFPFATNGSVSFDSTSNMKGIFIQNAFNNGSFTFNASTLVDGCVYNRSSTTFSSLSLNTTTLNSETLCYLRNTHIMTDRGYLPIQDLSVGDLVLSYGPISESQIISHSEPLFTPVKWIQSFKPSFKNSSTMPIRFQKDSLGVNVPQKDLWLSPFHGIFVDGKMTQAQEFINGTTITQDFDVEEVEYFHFETEEHCAVDAEGVKSETFINVNYPIRNLPSLNDVAMSHKESESVECM